MTGRLECSWCGRVIDYREDVVITLPDLVSGVNDRFHYTCWEQQKRPTGLAG